MPSQVIVLLVDDQDLVVAAVKRLLAGEPDIALHCCRDARDAIVTANRIDPSVILQELAMPDGTGFTLLERFRRNRPTAATPIVVLSSQDDPETRARAASEGAADFFVTLPDAATLAACLRRHAGHTAIATLDASALSPFREADAASGADFTGELIDEFMREASSQVEQLRAAAARGDTAAVRATAHSLKGSSLTMGAHRLAALCDRIEAREGDASRLAVEIDREFVKVGEAFTAERRKWDQR